MELSRTTSCSSEDRSGFTYKSPLRSLVRFFKRSRDDWKRKYMEIKKEIKRFRNRAADATKSRDRWKQRAEQLQGRVDELTARLAGTGPADDRHSEAEKKGRCCCPRR